MHPVTEALQLLPYCNFSGDDHAALSSGRWYKDAEGEYFYEPETCRIRRLSAEAARSCLSGKHIAFIGDSVTRYEYLSLVHFLSKKQYMERYGASVSGEPSLVNEKDFSSWEDFFVNGSARIADAVDAQAAELCDCHRTPAGDMAITREHREFVVHQQGEAPVSVSYHFSYNYPSVEESMLHKLIRLFACGEQHPDVVVLNMVRGAQLCMFVAPALLFHCACHQMQTGVCRPAGTLAAWGWQRAVQAGRQLAAQAARNRAEERVAPGGSNGQPQGRAVLAAHHADARLRHARAGVQPGGRRAGGRCEADHQPGGALAGA